MGDRRRRRERYVIDQPFTRKSFYQDGGYLADYAPEDLAHVIDELDADLLETLGYALPDRPQVQRHPANPANRRWPADDYASWRIGAHGHRS
jgi:hypothetical protein